jgi:putative NADH-flavin reductase
LWAALVCTSARLANKEEATMTRVAFLGLFLTVLVLGPWRFAAAEDLAPIVVIGATARTAEQFIPLALERGHRVIGLARRPEAVTLEHERFTVVKGDVYDTASLEAALSGTEIVVSLFGPRITMADEVPVMDLYSAGYTNLIAAMRTKGNTRLFATTSTGAQKSVDKKPPLDAPRHDQWLWQVRGIYNDMQLAERIVHGSGLDYTILRPSQLMPEPPRDDLKIIVDADAPHFTLITYTDFAQWILDELQSDEYTGTVVGIYSDRTLQYGVNF